MRLARADGAATPRGAAVASYRVEASSPAHATTMIRAKRKLSQPSSPVEPPTAAATLVKGRGQWSESHKELWEQGLLLGASIQTDQGRAIRAHISVLVAHSPYIRGLLTSGLAESSVVEGTEQQISLLDVDHSAMAAIPS